MNYLYHLGIYFDIYLIVLVGFVLIAAALSPETNKKDLTD